MFRCSLCKSEKESVQHLFYTGSWTYWLWDVILLKLKARDLQAENFLELAKLFVKRYKGKGLTAAIAKTAFSAILYRLWEARNKVIFREEIVDRLTIKKQIGWDVKPSL